MTRSGRGASKSLAWIRKAAAHSGIVFPASIGRHRSSTAVGRDEDKSEPPLRAAGIRAGAGPVHDPARPSLDSRCPFAPLVLEAPEQAAPSQRRPNPTETLKVRFHRARYR